MGSEILSDDFVRSELDFWNVPGLALAVGRGGETLLAKGYGKRDLEQDLPMTADTLGGIASCSKSFCSAVAASLVEEGILSFDTPIREWIPDFALWDEEAGKRCTLRDMLLHRTGLAGHDGMWPAPGLSRREYLRRLRYLEPNKSFRSAVQYSNTIYNAVGCILEEVSGKPYETLVRERILEPLGMTRTVLSADAMGRDGNAAAGYFGKERTSPLVRMPLWEMNVGVPAAGVCSSPREMLHWLLLHAGNGVYQGRRIFSEEMMAELHRPEEAMSAFPWAFPEVPGLAFYGMAWKTAPYRDRLLVYHCGEIEGYCSIELFVPGTDLVLFAFCNRHCPNTPLLLEMAYTVVDAVLGYPRVNWAERLHPYERVFRGSCANWEKDLFPHTAAEDAPHPPTHDLADYAGTFFHPGYGPLQVSLENGMLYLHWKNWLLPLEHAYYDTFRVRNLKMDTLFVTLPMTYHYDELTGKVQSFTLRLEETVPPIRFVRVPEKDAVRG